MSHGLMISHLKNTRYLHGGHVYRESIKKMLMANDPGLTMDEVFVHRQHHPYWRMCRQIYDLLISSCSRYPAKVNHFRTNEIRRKIESGVVQRHYSLFVISGAEMLWSLELLPIDVPLLYISHNIEHRLYGQQVARYAAVPGLRRLLGADAEKFKAFEIEHLKRLRYIVTIAEEDRETLRAYCPEARIVTIMPSFDYAPHVRTMNGRSAGLRLGFLGNLEWWPNRRGLQWFLDDIFPHLKSDVELHLYGQGSLALSVDQRIHGHGFVPDLTEVWKGVDLMIQPITCGAGVNIKVAEALYNRRPIVATPLALRGISLTEDPAIKVLSTAGAWIDYLNGPLPAQQARHEVRRENAALFSLRQNAVALQDLLAPPGPEPVE